MIKNDDPEIIELYQKHFEEKRKQTIEKLKEEYHKQKELKRKQDKGLKEKLEKEK